ncbi:hypothetical protein HNO88_000504 [Novosphingobium chloroacetimidivorans]|uniref:DUF3168 domain-containing protein n=1 Tax=Novosphingobium chloroacetimidivorans TaxID=1428314 RepID=A0A7W7NVJ7_9SPHN|nr:hypothetical protein [Novosphingobium chloroacetimidivorans]MBB4857197.1 hypothetical protein [Novosphingobium chloroacetimidivorans]
MEAQLLARLRADPGVAAVAGTIATGTAGRPAIDWIERKSDAKSGFPAGTLQSVSSGRLYDQDGPSGLQQKRIRFESYGLSYEQARKLADAAIKALEPAQDVDGIRFHRSKVAFDRDFPPEDLGGGLKVFRTLIDFMIPATPA